MDFLLQTQGNVGTWKKKEGDKVKSCCVLKDDLFIVLHLHLVLQFITLQATLLLFDKFQWPEQLPLYSAPEEKNLMAGSSR
jgi:hypothetical protein